jgi:hypothetical protein
MDGSQLAQQGMGRGGLPGGPPPGGMRGAAGLLPGGPVTSIVIAALLVLTCVVLAIAFYQLFRKAGMSGALGLLMLVPVVNLGVALYLAFVEWPIIAELGRLRLQLASLTEAVRPPDVQASPAAGAPPVPTADATVVTSG